MDNRGTAHDTPADLTYSFFAEIPQNGFEWTEGLIFASAKTGVSDVFLTPRAGPVRHVPFSRDLYVDVLNLDPTKDAILAFAHQHGSLYLIGRHFHRKNNSQPDCGESFGEWALFIRRYQAAFDLWERAKHGRLADLRWIETYCRPLWKGGPWPLQRPHNAGRLRRDPIGLARAVVIETANYHLAPATRNVDACALPGCTPPRYLPDGSSQTRGFLRLASGEQAQLVVASTDLLTTAWLQFAGYLSGERLVKRCEAPDCGLLMDVTDSARPGARRMHPRCEERIRKQRYRRNLRKKGNPK